MTVTLIIFALSFIAGVIPGAVFNLSVGSYARVKQRESPGRFYAVDLIGAALGGFVTSILILPLIGIQYGFFMLAVVGGISGVYMYLSRVSE